MAKVQIVTIATEAGTHFPGQTKAAEAIYAAGIQQKLLESGLDVVENSKLLSRDAAVASAAKWQPSPKEDGVRNEQKTLLVLNKAYDELTDCLDVDDGRFTLLIGGDCTILQPVLSAFHAIFHGKSRSISDVGLIYMDGDVDLSVPAEAAASIDATGVLDAMTMSHLMRRPGCLPSFSSARCSSRPDGSPLVTPENVVFFGFDPLQPSASHWVFLTENGCKVFTRPTVRANAVAAATAALSWMESRFDFIVLHFDVDVIDSGEFPLANYPHYAGLAAEQAFAALKVFLSSPKVKAMTITEVNPNNDPDNTMVTRVVDAMVEGLKGRL
ncbi:restless-like transposase [Purpureocillium lavendulum]|uniref:Restless-like transposase n=1 Tax=Purpureocillium lavendulum TaxID=1247861 RepID=A0AB34G5Y4_9HYPO|nr:restless-like transposase [Purpureocillium lavendulum]